MKKIKLLLLCAALLAVALAAKTTPAAAVCYPSCDTYCVGKPASTVCGCPQWTDRWCRTVTCGSWNTVGGCWSE